MPACSVKTCKNWNGITKRWNIKYFNFPRDPHIRNKWVEACGRAGDSNFNIKNVLKMGKTNAEYCKEYYHRKKAAKATEKKTAVLPVEKLKSKKEKAAERQRAYILRKKIMAQSNQSSVNEVLPVERVKTKKEKAADRQRAYILRKKIMASNQSSVNEILSTPSTSNSPIKTYGPSSQSAATGASLNDPDDATRSCKDCRGRVCSIHFSKEAYRDTRHLQIPGQPPFLKLKINAIPTKKLTDENNETSNSISPEVSKKEVTKENEKPDLFLIYDGENKYPSLSHNNSCQISEKEKLRINGKE